MKGRFLFLMISKAHSMHLDKICGSGNMRREGCSTLNRQEAKQEKHEWTKTSHDLQRHISSEVASPDRKFLELPPNQH